MVIYYLIGETTMIKAKYFVGFVLSAILIAGISFYDEVTGKVTVTAKRDKFVADFCCK